MGKLYVFGIGGTGSRVLKALTMLLASGVKCGTDTVVPVIIDPDVAAADLTRTVETMKKYMAIREKLAFDSGRQNRFFKTGIQQSVQNFCLPLQNVSDVKFSDYMGVSTMDKNNRALVNMLFSKDNLESDMRVGFKGNPNIGSVVLNQFAGSQEFREFSNSFQQGDKVFIISSIFGGTGASGFPLLLKTLRSNNRLPNFNLIQTAPIGAVAVLPYFGVKQDDGSKIDSATFISKTKSALSYYERNISRNKSIDALYYVADDDRNMYENHEGGQEQQNMAHVVELISALAILDFLALDIPAHHPDQPAPHKEFGIAGDSREIIWGDMGTESQKLLKKPLTRFLLFAKYMKEVRVGERLSQSWTRDRKLDRAFFDSPFIKDVTSLQDDFLQWLKEMGENKRGFSPFELKEDKRNLFGLVKGVSPKRLMSRYSNYALFDAALNNPDTKPAGEPEQQFMELFYQATGKLVKDKFNFE
jgi:hypothetical protein